MNISFYNIVYNALCEGVVVVVGVGGEETEELQVSWESEHIPWVVIEYSFTT